MGASCVRDCERTAHELYSPPEDTLPVNNAPGLSYEPVSSAFVPNGGAQDSSDVKVGATFANPLAAITGNSSPAVPPLNGLKWLQQGTRISNDPNAPQESARFNEVTPRGSVAGEFGTPAASPRDPRESPRPPDEGRQDGAVAGNSGSTEVSYEGERLNDMKHGVGRLRMNGSTYEGEFATDNKHGQGVLTWDDGRQYRGQFQDGKFHGSAVMTWPDGRKYSGQYIDDRKHGEGTFSWQDGRRYQGQWVIGKRHGIGVYTNAKALTRTGMWEMDRPLHWEAPQASSEPPRKDPSVHALGQPFEAAGNNEAYI